MKNQRKKRTNIIRKGREKHILMFFYIIKNILSLLFKQITIYFMIYKIYILLINFESEESLVINYYENKYFFKDVNIVYINNDEMKNIDKLIEK